MSNIFTSIIQALNTISVRGEHDINTMQYVIKALHQIERAANEPDQEEVSENS